ncbi:MAG: GNAT family N-acetyltransferase [Elainellaceae cyanobacterium]
MISVITPESDAQLDQVRGLIHEFVDWLRQHHPDHLHVINEYFEGSEFKHELDTLPGRYSAPEGCLLLALDDNQPAGCIAFRKLDEHICEMKRLFVPVQFQRRGIGQTLTKMLIQKAREIGYSKMRLDTGIFQSEAQELYKKLGFRGIEPYYSPSKTLEDGLIFMELDLQVNHLGTDNTQERCHSPIFVRHSAECSG